MKALIFFGIVGLLLVACTAPPQEATRAGIVDLEADDLDEVENSPDEPEETQDLGIGNVIAVTEPHALEAHGTYDEVPVDIATSTFEFEGYGPGKSHLGTFDEWDGSLYVHDGAIIGGEGTIQTASVNTGIGGLDNHLRTDDFFDAATYPTIEIESTELADSMLTVHLTLRGITKQVTFPVQVTENSISTDFVLDTTPFGMPSTAANKEVRIAFEMKI